MTDVVLGEKALPLLPGAHRVIRALDASDAPFVGLLVTRGDGVAVQLDAEALAGWPGWRFAGAEHVVGPIDVVRRVDGHDVLLPVCTERVTTLLARRHAVEETLALGECSTLVASLLRGIDELGEGAAETSGGWWVTGEGRPVFVIGEGDDACAGAVRIIELVAEGCRDKAMGRLIAYVLRGLHEARSRPRIPRFQIEEWERALLEIATPRPLRCDVHAPERARDVARATFPRPVEGPALRSRAQSRSRSGRQTEGPAMAVWSRGRVVGDRCVRLVLSLRQRRRPREDARPSNATTGPRRGRRRTLLVAAGAAAVVLVGGLLLPVGEPGEAAEETTVKGGIEVEFSPSPSPDAANSAAMAAEGDSVAAASALLRAASECAENPERTCEGVVVDGATGALSVLGEIAAGVPVVELVDEYGDVAVIRVSSGETPNGVVSESTTPSSGGHVLVLVRMDEKWLVRDVYDVADQPQ